MIGARFYLFNSMHSLIVASAALTGNQAWLHPQRVGVRVSASPRLAVESGTTLEAQFEAVKAASFVAGSMAPAIAAAGAPKPRRKRDVVRGALQKAGAVLSLRRELGDAARAIVDESCDVDEPEVCTDESVYKKTVGSLVGLIGQTLRFSRGDATAAELADAGDAMEAGWESKAQGSALKRTTEVWAFLGRAALKVLKARKTKGTPEEVSAAKTATAEYIRDSLFTLGPTFVKLGQVISTRSDVLEPEYIEVLKDLQVRDGTCASTARIWARSNGDGGLRQWPGTTSAAEEGDGEG